MKKFNCLFVFVTVSGIFLFSCSSSNKERNDTALHNMEDINVQMNKLLQENEQLLGQFSNNVVMYSQHESVKKWNDMATMVAKMGSDYRKELESIKLELVQTTDGVDRVEATSRIMNPITIHKKGAIGSVEKFFGIQPASEDGKANWLNKKTMTLHSVYLSYVYDDSLVTDAEVITATDGVNKLELSGADWEVNTFSKKTVLEALYQITVLQNNSALAESVMLQYLMIKQQKGITFL